MGRLVLLAMGVAVVVLVLLRAFVISTYAVTSESMAPTISGGDRLIVLKTTTIERGDLIVFDAEHLLGEPATAYVKRVIGVPGDRLGCCTEEGRLTLNGAPLDEPYVEGVSDQITFEVIVPDRRYWVLGDQRAASADSRSALGRPGGGMLRADDVIGEVAWRYWPLERLGALASAEDRSVSDMRDNPWVPAALPDREESAP
ncbi:MAG: signal peptidase I [Actinomycetia bacterium]|nr:signal peptidase I [Actinomycetes bacterium]